MTPTTSRIELMDTTLRDGEQTRNVSFSPEEKVNIGKALLKKLKVDRIEVASARVSDGEQQAVRTLNEWASEQGCLDRIEILGFVDGTKSVDWITQAGGQVINLLTKGSELHCRKQLKKTLEEHVIDIRATIAYAHQQGLRVNMYLEDWSNGYANSPDYVFALMDEVQDLSIERFLLPDTLGVLSPNEVYDAIKAMTCRYPQLHFDFHPHNDYGLATANVVAAVKAGIKGIHGTINCLGERAGNASLAEVAVVLKDKMNIELSLDEHQIFSLSKMVERFSGKWVSANAPIVGDDVFTQTAGIHADGDHKGGLYESVLSPERFQRKRSYALGKMSGKASLIKNLDELGISLSKENQEKVLAKVVQLGDSKQVITLDDLPFIIADVLESSHIKHVVLIECEIVSTFGGQSKIEIALELNGDLHRSSGTGNGGFDAFVNAINKILASIPFSLPDLVNYEVHIPKGGTTSALTESIITWNAEGRTIKTRGVHANQVFSAIFATLRVVNLQLHELYSSQRS